MDKKKIYIESDIKPPQRKTKSWATILQSMEIGESFLTPSTSSVRPNMYNTATKVGVRISIKEDEGNNVRVFKVDGPVIPIVELDKERNAKKLKKKQDSKLVEHLILCEDEECMVGGHEKWRAEQ